MSLLSLSSLPLLSVSRLFVVFAVVLVAFFVRAIIGFGSGLIAVSILVQLLPVRTVVPLVYLLDFAAAVALGAYDFAHVQWQELRLLLPLSLVGVALGAYWLKIADPEAIVGILGVFILIYVAYAFWFRPERLPPIGRLWAIPLGLVGGVLSSLYGGGGPPLVAYLQLRRLDKRAFRATFQTLAFVDASVRGVFYLLLGMLQPAVLQAALWLAPVVALGLLMGNWVHFRVSERLFLNLTLLVLLLAGLRLLGV